MVEKIYDSIKLSYNHLYIIFKGVYREYKSILSSNSSCMYYYRRKTKYKFKIRLYFLQIKIQLKHFAIAGDYINNCMQSLIKYRYRIYYNIFILFNSFLITQ